VGAPRATDRRASKLTEAGLRLVQRSLTLVVLFVLTTCVVAAQQSAKVYRIGILTDHSPVSSMIGPEPSGPVRALLQRLRELGYVYGQNLLTEPRSAEGQLDRVPGLAAELVRLKVDVIVSSGGTARAARDATATIPIVMAGLPDPVGSGLVASLAHPGGNVTGLSSAVGPEITGKRLELLKEAVPRISRVAYVATKSDWESSPGERVRTAARALGIALLHVEVSRPDHFTDAFAVIARQRPSALLVQPSAVNYVHRRLIADFAAKQRLPAMYGFSDFADAGGLMAYGQSITELTRRAADYVDRILRGARPGDLPIEQPTKFALVINLKTAKALELTIPPALLLRAELVIE
jgi:putative tryptophan/tyrosine transport system substrate-binding protein